MRESWLSWKKSMLTGLAGSALCIGLAPLAIILAALAIILAALAVVGIPVLFLLGGLGILDIPLPKEKTE